MNASRFIVPADHPSLPGHFPGRPIVPGVLLLDAVLRCAAEQRPDPPTRLVRAKFPAPVGPGAEVSITLSPRAGCRMGFTCHSAGILVLVGELGWPDQA